MAEGTTEAVQEPAGRSEPAPATSPADLVMESTPELTASLLGSMLADQDIGPSISTPAASVPKPEPFV